MHLKQLKHLLLLFIALHSSLALLAQNKQPNVVIIVADDIGLGDISYYRKAKTEKLVVETPNIDALAENGIAFTDAHSPTALCAPSRYSLMTGNYTYRSPKPWGVWGSYEKSPIHKDQLTLGKLMKQAGYQTAFLGKWHLGGDFYRKSDPNKIYRDKRTSQELDIDLSQSVGGDPLRNGFDYSLTFPAGIQDIPYAVYENSKWMKLAPDSKIAYISKEKMLKKGVKLDKLEGLGDSNWDPHQMGPLLAHKAVEYIEKHASKENPFFMYYCAQAVHLPHTPPDSLNGRKIKGATPVKHLDMVVELDAQMEMVIAALKAKGVYENTLFIFTSDNGGLTRRATLATGHQPSNGFRGGKNQIHEGGHRVPFIAHWPKHIAPNTTSNALISGIDLMATLAAVTKQKLPKGQAMDSKNLVPLFRQRRGAKGRKSLLLQGGTGRKVVYRKGNMKLVIQLDKKDKTDNTRTPIALFDLEKSPNEAEKSNLINDKQYADLVTEMFDKYNKTRNKGKATR